MKSFYECINRTIRRFVGDREITAQEAALDAVGLPLISYSCECIYVQARRPEDTVHIVKRKEHRLKIARTSADVQFEDMVYQTQVGKYMTRK